METCTAGMLSRWWPLPALGVPVCGMLQMKGVGVPALPSSREWRAALTFHEGCQQGDVGSFAPSCREIQSNFL